MIDSEAHWSRLFAQNLAVVVAVLETEHVTRAAVQLGIPQPTVSRTLHRVERELDVSLVQPHGRGVRATAAGKALLPNARRALAALQAASDDLREVIDPERGTVSLAFLHTLGVRDVPRLVDAFRAAHPDIRFALKQGAAEDVVRRLTEGEVDVVVLAPLPTGADLASVPLREERLFLAVPEGHPLSRRRQVDLRQAAGEPFVAMTPGHGLRTIFDDLCARAGFEPALEFLGEDVATLRGLVGAGLGVAVLPPGTSDDTGTTDVPIRRPAARRVIGAVWPRTRHLSPAARAFVAFLQESGERVLAER